MMIEMELLEINNKEYEIVDKKAREKAIFRESSDNNKEINEHKVVSGEHLIGGSKQGPTYIQQENENETILVQHNEGTVESLRVKNKNEYTNKIGINFDSTHKNHLRNINIQGYKTGLNVFKSSFNYFEDILIDNCIRAIVIGDEENPESWVGANCFSGLKIGSKYGVINKSKDNSKTINFNDTIFEGTNHGIENAGQLKFNNCYFGDQKQNEDETLSVEVVKANEGSLTELNNCVIGLCNSDYADGRKDSIFKMNGTDENPSSIYVDGGELNIANDNTRTTIATIYESNNKNNRLFLDNVLYIPSKNNTNHNQIPFRLYSFSCLASKNPIKNYLVNGTMRNEKANQLIDSYVPSTPSTFDENIVNPFHGKVIKSAPGNSLTYYYKIPRALINKKMVLEIYVSDTDDSNGIRISYDNSDCVETGIKYPSLVTNRENIITPQLIRYTFTPTKEIGKIFINSHWQGTKETVIAGVILKEGKYENNLSCYEDDSLVYNPTQPTKGSWEQGDKIYSTDAINSGCLGWICTVSGTFGGDTEPTFKKFGILEG